MEELEIKRKAFLQSCRSYKGCQEGIRRLERKYGLLMGDSLFEDDEEIDELDKLKIATYRKEIDYVDHVLNSLRNSDDIQSKLLSHAIYDVYIEKSKTVAGGADEVGICRANWWKKMYEHIDQYLR